MRVLVAYENGYRFYREVIARAIRDHRPHLQVRNVGLEELAKELVPFDPHTVVSSRPELPDTTNTVAAWVELPAETILHGTDPPRWQAREGLRAYPG
jgi:hypothetical protein